MPHVIRTDDTPNVYTLLTSIVAPRPISWTSTIAACGTANLAPHSFFTVVCVSPPLVAFSSVGEKDTLRNIRDIPEFVSNFCSEEHLTAINDSSAPFPAGIDEAESLGICTTASQVVRPPRVTDSPASLECTVASLQELGNSTLVIGHVRAITVREDILNSDGLNAHALRGLSRLGPDLWGLPPELVHLARPAAPP